MQVHGTCSVRARKSPFLVGVQASPVAISWALPRRQRRDPRCGVRDPDAGPRLPGSTVGYCRSETPLAYQATCTIVSISCAVCISPSSRSMSKSGSGARLMPVGGALIQRAPPHHPRCGCSHHHSSVLWPALMRGRSVVNATGTQPRHGRSTVSCLLVWAQRLSGLASRRPQLDSPTRWTAWHVLLSGAVLPCHSVQ